MKLYPHKYIKEKIKKIFIACNVPEEEAEIVTNELVESSLMGLDSHGIIRCIFYVDEILKGRIKPGAKTRMLKETPTTAIFDVGNNFVQIGANKMVEIVYEKAKNNNIACVVSKNCHHVGRLGSYVQKLAKRDIIGLAFVNSLKSGHYVCPWGGKEGRLATNPIAYGIPREDYPVVFDMSTSMISEGKIRTLMHEGKKLPANCALNFEGKSITDPKDFYGPPIGTILPLGAELGYKGFGLGLLAEIMNSVLSGEEISDEYRYLNGLCIIGINPNAFCGIKKYKKLMKNLTQYITTTPTTQDFNEVVMPGEYDFRTYNKRLKEGIPIPDDTWKQIKETAKRVGINI